MRSTVITDSVTDTPTTAAVASRLGALIEQVRLRPQLAVPNSRHFAELVTDLDIAVLATLHSTTHNTPTPPTRSTPVTPSAGPDDHDSTSFAEVLTEIATAYSLVYAQVTPQTTWRPTNLAPNYGTVRAVALNFPLDAILTAFSKQPPTIVPAYFSGFFAHPRFALLAMIESLFAHLRDPLAPHEQALSILAGLFTGKGQPLLSSATGILSTAAAHLAKASTGNDEPTEAEIRSVLSALDQVDLPTLYAACIAAIDDVRPLETVHGDTAPLSTPSPTPARTPASAHTLPTSIEEIVALCAAGGCTPEVADLLTDPDLCEFPTFQLPDVIDVLAARRPQAGSTASSLQALLDAHDARVFNDVPHPGYEQPHPRLYRTVHFRSSSFVYARFPAAVANLPFSARVPLLLSYDLWVSDPAATVSLFDELSVPHDSTTLPLLLDLYGSVAQLVRLAPLIRELPPSELIALARIANELEFPLDLVFELLPQTGIPPSQFEDLLRAELSVTQILDMCH